MKEATRVRIWGWMRENRAFCIVAIILSVMYLALSLFRHWHFGSAGFDLGIFDQAIWHYSRFEAPMGTIRVTSHLLADHFHPILIALAPLYWMIPKPETLLVVQNLLWLSGVLPIYLFALHRGHSKIISILLVLSYALFWGTTLVLNLDFHEIAFALLAIPWAIYLIELKRWPWFWLSVIILLLTKEEMGFLVAFLGLYLLVKGYWRQGVAAFVGGVAWFGLAVDVFIPYFGRAGGGGFGYWTYSNFGNSPLEAIKTIVTHPIRAIQLLFTPDVKLYTLHAIFWPFLFLPLISPIMIVGIPLILQRFWSDQSLYWMANFHYTGTLAPILVMAATDSLARLKQRMSGRSWTDAAVWVVVFLMLAGNLYYAPKYQLRHLAEADYWQLSASDQTGRRVLATISPTASVSAQNSILPHLSQRNYAYLIHNDQPFYYSEYIVIAAGAKLYPFATFEMARAYVEEKLAGRGYELVVDEGDWLIWQNVQVGQTPPVTDISVG
jgi:uncharacterized membrane protein